MPVICFFRLYRRRSTEVHLVSASTFIHGEDFLWISKRASEFRMLWSLAKPVTYQVFIDSAYSRTATYASCAQVTACMAKSLTLRHFWKLPTLLSRLWNSPRIRLTLGCRKSGVRVESLSPSHTILKHSIW